MPCSDADKYTLDFWSFMSDYRDNSSIWGELLWDIHQALVRNLGTRDLRQEEIEQIFGVILSRNKMFYAMCESKPVLPNDLYETMGVIFARCVVDEHWHSLGY